MYVTAYLGAYLMHPSVEAGKEVGQTDVFHTFYILLIKSHRLYKPLIFCPGVFIVYPSNLARRFQNSVRAQPQLLLKASLTKLDLTASSVPCLECIRCGFVISFLAFVL